MSQALRAVKIDENEEDKVHRKLQMKKTVGVTVAGETKRSALGELGNRAVVKNNDLQKENINYNKYAASIKNAKPRVDTYWKKGTTTHTDAVSTKISNTKKPVTRSSAQVVDKVTVPASKAVNNEKITKVKVVKGHLEEKQLVSIRREDSNLSRRSLSKLRQALCKDKKEKTETTVANKKPIVQEKATIESHSTKLLDEVENIDADDTENPILVSEYVNDIYAYLYHLETNMSINEHHLEHQSEVTPKMRSVLIDWINEVHYQFHLLPETFYMTVGIIDRYLQTYTTTQRQHLQLVGVTALFIAAKYEELYPPDIADYVYITDDTYTKDQIFSMEIKIMKTLGFQVGRPLGIHFLRRFSKAVKANNTHHSLAKYFLELSTVEYNLSHYKPSETAAASLFLALKVLNKKPSTPDNQLWTPTVEFYSQYSVENLRPIIRMIAKIVKHAPTAKLKAVYNKYNSSKFENIASISELNGPVIQKFCAEF